mmetsp:Transcript_11014/g.17445  ORF Transcript_11014/g.17445 Transcript_11014/m.17445 type:complete len:247 (+) Transcript_11014:1-741(+)
MTWMDNGAYHKQLGKKERSPSVSSAIAAIQRLSEEACPTFCESCQNECDEHAQFCSNCGNKLRRMVNAPMTEGEEERKYSKVLEETQAIQDQIFALEIELDQVTAVIETNAIKLHKAEDMLLAADATIKMQEASVGQEISFLQSLTGTWLRVSGHHSMSKVKIEASGRYEYDGDDGDDGEPREGRVHLINQDRREIKLMHNEGAHDHIFKVSPDGSNMDGYCPQNGRLWELQKVNIEEYLAEEGYA